MRKVNSTAIMNNIKVWVMRGYYDEEEEYCEKYLEDITLSNLPKEVVDRIALGYDVSVLYSEHDLLVIAKSKQVLDEYLALEGTPRFFHSLLHIGAQHPYRGYMCIASNLEHLRRGRNRAEVRRTLG